MNRHRTTARGIAFLIVIFGLFAAGAVAAPSKPVPRLIFPVVGGATYIDDFGQPMTAVVEVTLTDYGVDRFDPTLAPEVDISLPLEQRKPGGLGLHLIRRMVDSIRYEYDEVNRQSRITFRKIIADRRTAGRKTGG